MTDDLLKRLDRANLYEGCGEPSDLTEDAAAAIRDLTGQLAAVQAERDALRADRYKIVHVAVQHHDPVAAAMKLMHGHAFGNVFDQPEPLVTMRTPDIVGPDGKCASCGGRGEVWGTPCGLCCDQVDEGTAQVMAHPKVRALVEAAELLRHAVCSNTGFAAAVRADSGLAYPWPEMDHSEARLNAALAALTAEGAEHG